MLAALGGRGSTGEKEAEELSEGRRRETRKEFLKSPDMFLVPFVPLNMEESR